MQIQRHWQFVNTKIKESEFNKRETKKSTGHIPRHKPLKNWKKQGGITSAVEEMILSRYRKSSLSFEDTNWFSFPTKYKKFFENVDYKIYNLMRF